MKTCNKCGESKPLDEYRKRKAGRDGHHARCTLCMRDEKRAYDEDNRAQITEYRKEYRQTNSAKISEYKKAFYAERKPEHAEYARQYNIDNRAAQNARSRAYRATPEGRAVCKAYAKQYDQEHAAEKLARSNARRAWRLNATPAWSEQAEITRLYRTSTSAPGAHVDHVIPLKNPLVCGLHCMANLKLELARVNMSKGNRFNQAAESARQLEVTRAALAH